eukprot:2090040-Amphidinium_carterae.2
MAQCISNPSLSRPLMPIAMQMKTANRSLESEGRREDGSTELHSHVDPSILDDALTVTRAQGV